MSFDFWNEIHDLLVRMKLLYTTDLVQYGSLRIKSFFVTLALFRNIAIIWDFGAENVENVKNMQKMNAINLTHTKKQSKFIDNSRFFEIFE